MGSHIIIAITIITVLFPLSSSRAENELTLEAAMGMASEAKPFTSDWSGSVGPEGLMVKEFAFKAKYQFNFPFSVSSTIGFLKDYDYPTFWIEIPPTFIERPFSRRDVTYFRPTVQSSFQWIKLEIGALFYWIDVDTLSYVFRDDVFDPGRKPRPVFGIEFGERDFFVYGSFLNSFPFVAGGVYEMGLVKKISGIYEHKVFGSMSEYQNIALGYRGEFRVHKNMAITSGFSWGRQNLDNVYMMTVGVKSPIDL